MVASCLTPSGNLTLPPLPGRSPGRNAAGSSVADITRTVKFPDARRYERASSPGPSARRHGIQSWSGLIRSLSVDRRLRRKEQSHQPGRAFGDLLDDVLALFQRAADRVGDLARHRGAALATQC